MDHDELRKEIQRLQTKLATLDPASKEYAIVSEQLVNLCKLEMEFNEVCDKQLQRQNEFELKKEQLGREFELKKEQLGHEFDLKEKEIEQRHDVDVKKLDDAAEEAFNRRKAEKKQAWWDLAKLGVSGFITAGLILVTKKSEEAVIFGQHVWSLIPKGPKLL